MYIHVLSMITVIGYPLCALNYWIFQSDFTLSEVKRQKQRGMAKGLRRQPWHSGKVAYHVQQTTTSVGSRVTQVQLRPVAIYLMAMPDYDWGSVLLGSTTRKGLQVMHQCFPHVCNHQCTSSKCGSSHSKKPWKTSPRILKRSRSFFGCVDKKCRPTVCTNSGSYPTPKLRLSGCVQQGFVSLQVLVTNSMKLQNLPRKMCICAEPFTSRVLHCHYSFLTSIQ